ncbi:F-box only protein 5 [Varanus komodoensis]|uniref:F-box only protein 5 n=1 Tax=Varanus komodoensis TaxID=61221 RepID=UPI001CF774DD|nr:F-box only protein 5 [Varanus komodoensis]KAF7253617.1 F-box only protein 5 [Varanus komodoensis]
MKRDINCSHVHCGLTPLKSTGTEKRSEDPSIANHNEEFCKECTKERLVHSDLQHESPKNVSIKSEGKTIHNKENHRLLWRHMNTIEMDIGNEDSGYSSLLGNQPESSEHDVILAGNINDTPNHSFSQRKNLLPVLHFEELVCSTLKKTSKRNQKTWAHVLDKIASRHSMDFINLIGKKVGLDKLDILSELFHGKFRHLLANILRHLSCMDLINVAKVSTTWKKILQDDKWAFQMYNKALELTLTNNAKSSEQADTREYALHREALAPIQKVEIASISYSKKGSRIKANNQSKQNSSSFSRHTLFSEVAKTLKNTESLKICHHCGSPAKYDSHLQRATCIREGCGFDFCTKCLCSYHTAKDCTSAKAVKPSSKLGALPGTKRSKQNLRRL